jgi:hypothetical protein
LSGSPDLSSDLALHRAVVSQVPALWRGAMCHASAAAMAATIGAALPPTSSIPHWAARVPGTASATSRRRFQQQRARHLTDEYCGPTASNYEGAIALVHLATLALAAVQGLGRLGNHSAEHDSAQPSARQEFALSNALVCRPPAEAKDVVRFGVPSRPGAWDAAPRGGVRGAASVMCCGLC